MICRLPCMEMCLKWILKFLFRTFWICYKA